jgi:hypothetical protein
MSSLPPSCPCNTGGAGPSACSSRTPTARVGSARPTWRVLPGSPSLAQRWWESRQRRDGRPPGWTGCRGAGGLGGLPRFPRAEGGAPPGVGGPAPRLPDHLTPAARPGRHRTTQCLLERPRCRHRDRPGINGPGRLSVVAAMVRSGASGLRQGGVPVVVRHSAMRRGADHRHWDRGVHDALQPDRAEQGAPQRTPFTVPDDQQVRVAGLRDEHVSRRAGDSDPSAGNRRLRRARRPAPRPAGPSARRRGSKASAAGPGSPSA